MARYESWREFRVALEQELGYELPPKFRRQLEESLFWAAIHVPFTEDDVEFAITMVNKMKRIWGEKE